MKMKKMEAFWNKSCLKGCKWSGLNAPDTETPLSHSVLELEESPFPIIGPLGYKEWAPQYESEKVWKISEQKWFQQAANGLSRGIQRNFTSHKWLQGMQMVQFEWPWHWNPTVSSNFKVGWFPFSHNWPSGVIRIGLPIWKWKKCKNIWANVAEQAANGPVGMSQALNPHFLTNS